MNEPDETTETHGAPHARRGGRQPVERLWDDDGFRERVAEIAEKRGMSLRDAVLSAGTNSDYLQKAHPYGRNINIMMRIAKVLEVDPAYLLFGRAKRSFQAGSEAAALTTNYDLVMFFDETMRTVAVAQAKAVEAMAEAMRSVAETNQRHVELLRAVQDRAATTVGSG